MALVTLDYGRAGATATAGTATGVSSGGANRAGATASAPASQGIAVLDGPPASSQSHALPVTASLVTGNGPFAPGQAIAPPASGLTTGDYGRASALASASVVTGKSIWDYRPAAARALAARAQDIDLGTFLDEAVQSDDRVPTFSVRADWNGDGGFSHQLSDLTPVVESFTVTRETSSDLPEAVGLISGTTATSAEIQLGGTWRPTGPIPGQTYISGTYASGTTDTPNGTFTQSYVFGHEFMVRFPAQVDALRYRRTATTTTVSIAAIFDVDTQLEVPNTRVTFTNAPTSLPAWHTASLATPFFPVVGKRYKMVFQFSGFAQIAGFFSTGPGQYSVPQGPLVLFSMSDATDRLQGTYKSGTTFGYPTQGDSDGKNYLIDVIVTQRVTLLGNPRGANTEPTKAFSPYRADADLAGKQLIGQRITVNSGMQTSRGPVTLPRLTGTVSAYTPDSLNRTVQLQGLDPVDRLRAEINQAAWGLSIESMIKYGAGIFGLAVNSQWLIDRVLRANGYFTSPPPGLPLGSVNLIFSATYHGSVIAEVAGYTDVSNYKDFAGTVSGGQIWKVFDHPFKMLAPDPASAVTYLVNYAATYPVICTPGNCWATSMWVRVPTATSTGMLNLSSVTPSIPQNGLQSLVMRAGINMANLQPRIEMTYRPSSTATNAATAGADLVTTLGAPGSPSPGTWAFLGFAWNFTSSGITLTIHYNGTNYSANLNAGPVGNYVTYYDAGYVTNLIPGNAGGSLSNVSVWFSGSATPVASSWVGRSWVPQAKVDPGANVWYGVPELIAEESFSLIKEVCQSELAQFGFDENAMPYFRSRAVPRISTVNETLTADRELSNLVATVDESTVRNVINISAVARVAWVSETIYEAKLNNEITVPANGTATFTLAIPQDCVRVWLSGSDPFMIVPGEGYSDAVDNIINRDKLICSFVYTDAINVDGSTLNYSLGFFLQRVNARSMKLKITNNVNRNILFSTPNKYDSNGNLTSEGTGAFRIPGRILTPMPPNVGNLSTPGSITKYGRQVYDFSGESDRWIQSLESGYTLASALMDWTGSPKPVLAEIEVPHNPRRKLYDVVELRDPSGMGSVIGRIAGIKTTYSVSDGARDALLVRPLTGPPGW